MSILTMLTDSYKVPMEYMYEDDTDYMYSYLESRGGGQYTQFFGLQEIIKKYFLNPITKDEVDEFQDMMRMHLGGDYFPRYVWDHVLDKHGGYLPLEIRAVKEGTIVPTKNVLMTIENTDPVCRALTTWVEPLLLQSWYPTTVSTLDHMNWRTIFEYLIVSADNPYSKINFALHDFGLRGSTSIESAGIGGCAHLVNFRGTDTTPALWDARKYYHEKCAGFSVPATEHSVIVSFGKTNEEGAYKHFLDKFAAQGKTIACVSDAYDLYNAVNNYWGESLNQQIIDSGVTLVVRPDSGDPTVVPVDVVEILAEKFGYTENYKNFKVLNSSVRVIQGDGVNSKTIPMIYDNLLSKGFSAENLTLGMGTGLLQDVNRDTFKMAIKASAKYKRNAGWVDIFKDPITDPGKKSKVGRFSLIKDTSGSFQTVPYGHSNDLLEVVYRNGELLRDQTLGEIREISMDCLAGKLLVR